MKESSKRIGKALLYNLLFLVILAIVVVLFINFSEDEPKFEDGQELISPSEDRLPTEYPDGKG